MPRIRLSRLPVAVLLLAFVFVVFHRNELGGLGQRLTQVVQQDAQSTFQTDSQPVQYSRRIVAVGDLHGDYENALRVLQMSEVVDASGDWSGKVDLFVQTGDIIDRGVDTIKMFLWMEQLRSQARTAGGDIVSHLGNHEWMNLLADWRYVYPKEIATFGSIASRQKMLQTGRIGRAWAANYSITSRIPLHPPMGPHSPFPRSASYDPSSGFSSVDSLPSDATGNKGTDLNSRSKEDPLGDVALSFVHGGLSPSYTHLTPYPSSINTLGHTLLHRLQTRPFPSPHPPAPYAGLPADASDAERSLYADDGPLWYRGWALKDVRVVCKEVDGVLAKIGVRRLIMGHTPNFDEITSRCGGKVIIIDTGISHAYGGALSALSIHYTLNPISPQAGSESANSRRWKEREVITALYPQRQEVLVVEERELEARWS